MQKIVIYILALLIACGIGVLWNLHIENTKAWALIIIFVFGGVAGVFSLIYPKYKKSNLFSVREALTIEEIYARYYSSSGLSKNVVLELWQEVAKILNLPVEKLRPTDEFGNELGPYRVIDDDLDSLVAISMSRIEKMGLRSDFSKIKTLDDYIRNIGQLLENSKESKKKDKGSDLDIGQNR